MQNAMKWLKASGSKGTGFDDASVASGKGPRGPLSDEEQRAKSMADALNFLRSNEPGAEVTMDETSSFTAGPY